MSATERDRPVIRVAPIVVDRAHDEYCVRVTAEATGPNPWNETITFRYTGAGIGAIEPTGDMALATFLLPAMRAGARLEIASPVSAQLLEALPRVQAMYSDWEEYFQTIEAIAPASATDIRRGEGAALFFSGGADAFYTLLTTEIALTHLVLIVGFDFEQHLTRRKADAIASARAVAEARDLQLLIVETNFRASPVTNAYWRYGHGAALFAVAHGLRGVVGTSLVSASDTQGSVEPWGTRPDLDPFWSTESVELLHEGYEARRWDKLRLVGADPLARKHLRVCSDESADAYNCGHCGKCRMTSLALYAMGELDAVETLPSQIHRRDVMGISLGSVVNQELMQQILAALNDAGDRRMAAVVRRKMAISKARRIARPARNVLRRLNRTARLRDRR
ncbi:MAG: hypothetical protein QOI95_2038 [Acidimicrobiaceae bacterium]|jgi:hypothetical protein